MSDQRRVTVALAEAFNLLVQSRVDGLSVQELAKAADIVVQFQKIVADLDTGSLSVVRTTSDSEEAANEAE